MDFARLLPLLAFLGLQDRYWAIIIVVIIVIIGIAYFARGRAT